MSLLEWDRIPPPTMLLRVEVKVNGETLIIREMDTKGVVIDASSLRILVANNSWTFIKGLIESILKVKQYEVQGDDDDA